jgi:ketosteroid isomerase-like protein
MASANVELVRSIFEAWECGDYSSSEWAHPGIEYVVVEGPEPDSRTGLAGMAEAWGEFLSAWDDWRIFADEYRELDDDRVRVRVHASGRSKASGLELEQTGARGGTCLFHVRSGRITRLVVYYDFTDLPLAPEAGP